MIDTSKDQFDHYVKNANFSFGADMCRTTNERNQIVDSSASAAYTELGCNSGTFVGSSWSQIQHFMVDRFLIHAVAEDKGQNDDFIVNAGVAGFPAEEQTFNVFWTYLGPVFAFLLFVAFIYPFYNILKQIVEEKELKLTEGMKMMGATNFAIMSSWWTIFALQFGILALIMMAAGKTIFVKSDKVNIFLYFFAFFMASTSFCYFLTSFFSEAKKAGIVGIMVFIAGAILSQISTIAGDDASLGQKFFFSLHPVVAYFLTTRSFTFFEAATVGVTANTVGTRVNAKSFSFADGFGMMIVDIFLYMFLTWYCEKVIPSEFGTNLPPHFLFMPSYWKTGEISGAKFEDYTPVSMGAIKILTGIEAVPEELKKQEVDNTCVQIKSLSKVYDTNKGKKVAVNCLDLTFYKNHITCLLGHNGAG